MEHRRFAILILDIDGTRKGHGNPLRESVESDCVVRAVRLAQAAGQVEQGTLLKSAFEFVQEHSFP